MALRPVTAYEDRLSQIRKRLVEAAGLRRLDRARRFPWKLQPWAVAAARAAGAAYAGASNRLDSLCHLGSGFAAGG
jgi:hypothetical protein